MFAARILFLWMLFFSVGNASAEGLDKKRPVPVASVELKAYLGDWFEVRRIPNGFQDNDEGQGVCVNSRATYWELSRGRVGVINSCERGQMVESVRGVARALKGSQNSKLKVNFTGLSLFELLGIGSGNYWILALGERNDEGLYSWSLVGEPDLKYAWILSRSQDMASEELTRALAEAEGAGYDVSDFIDPRQNRSQGDLEQVSPTVQGFSRGVKR